MQIRFSKKTQPLNNFFVSEVTLLRNDSALPIFLEYDSEARLFENNLTNDEILHILKALNFNKVRGQDVSVRIVKLCDQSIITPLIIFQNCIDTGAFLDT